MPAQVIVTLKDASGAYGTTPTITTGSDAFDAVVIRGTVTGEEMSALGITASVSGVTDSSPVGIYSDAVIGTVGNTNTNIAVSFVEGNYTVTKGTLAVTAPADVTAVYDGIGHTIAAPVVTKQGGASIDADSYTIYYSTTALNSANYGSGSTTKPEVKNVTAAEGQTIYYYIDAPGYNSVSGSATVKVTPAALSVTAEDTTITFGESAPTAGVTYSGFVNDETEAVLGGTLGFTYKDSSDNNYHAGSNVGTYIITPQGLTSANYDITFNPGTMTVGRKTITKDMFSLSNTTLDYDGTVKQPQITLNTGNTDVANDWMKSGQYTVSYLNNINAGTAIARISGEANYVGIVELEYTIVPKTVYVKMDNQSSGYNQALAELTYAFVDEEETVLELTDEQKQAYVTAMNLVPVTSVRKGYDIGTYEDAITITWNENPNYNLYVTRGNYTVTAATLTVKAQGTTVVYDGAYHSGMVSAKTGLFLHPNADVYYSTTQEINGTSYSAGTTEIPRFKDVGTHTVYYCAVYDNYAAVAGNYDVEITPANLTISVSSNKEMAYGDTPASALAELSANDIVIAGMVGGESASEVATISSPVFTTDYTQFNPVGEYGIHLNSGVTVSANYNAEYVDGKLTVNPRAVALSWPGTLTYEYNGVEREITATISNLVNGDSVYVSSYVSNGPTTNKGTAAGNYTAEAAALAGSNAVNYTLEGGQNLSTAWSITAASNA